MKSQRFGMTLCHVTIVLFTLFLVSAAPLFSAQQADDPGQSVPLLSPNQLEDVVAPIALYPDPLLSQVLVASTYPIEVVEAYQWLQRNPDLTGTALTQAASQQNWDPSVQALVLFPEVLNQISSDVTWITNLGNAFLEQPDDVMNAIQEMRLKAQQAGALSNSQEQVTTTADAGQQVIAINPSSPDIIYVPQCDPVWIWGPAVYYPYPDWNYPPRQGRGFMIFGAPIQIGLFLGAGWSGWGGWGWHPVWGAHTIRVNNVFIHRFNLNSAAAANLTGTVVWSHDASHRQGVPYPSRVLTEEYRPSVRDDLKPPPEAAPMTRPAPVPTSTLRSERLGDRPIAPDAPHRNHPAFGSIENGANRENETEQTDRGYSSRAPDRAAPAPQVAKPLARPVPPHAGPAARPESNPAPASNAKP